MSMVRPVSLVKKYKESRLCSDARIIRMVERLRVDSNKDASRFLKNVYLCEEPSSPEKISLEERE